MINRELSERSIFEEAVEIASPQERAAYLERACGGNETVRREVEALLAAHDRLEHFLPVAGGTVLPATRAEPVCLECPGMRIGPYKLLEQIGEGGMGVVFMAEQQEPVRRKVALKVIKPGMDSHQVIARFEAERQALALMDHPNIAKVFDAGTTDTGRPYFVMELIKGVPITNYCDAHRLTPRERLELCVSVCQAVQHAHQKGIIHRDLKPSNVLVALYDGLAVPTVIDFGVAKAAGAALTERTLFTGLGAVVGTLEYMAPEQAELNQLDIDTRADIYALGVLLYELLTGTTPLERKRLKGTALLEALRLIREEEPPRPSTRLGTTEESAAIAANRGLEPRRLSGLLRGELDWIAMKCLEKDRTRRYQSASALAMDLQCYLRDEPVQACPPSTWYRFGKFARRNKVALWTATAVGALVLLAMVGLTVATLRISQEKLRADGNATAARAAQKKADENARTAAHQRQLAFNTLEALVFEVQAQLTEVEDIQQLKQQFADFRATRQLKKHLLNKALAGLQVVTRSAENSAAIDHTIAAAHVQMGKILWWQQKEKGKQEFEQGCQIGAALMAADPSDRQAKRQLALAHAGLGDVSIHLRDVAAAREHYSRYLQLAGELAAAEPRSTEAMHDLAGAYQKLGTLSQLTHDREGALGFFLKSLDLVEAWAVADPHDARAPRALLARITHRATLPVHNIS